MKNIKLLTMWIRWVNKHVDWLFFGFIDESFSRIFNIFINFGSFELASHCRNSICKTFPCIQVVENFPEKVKCSNPGMQNCIDIRRVQKFEFCICGHAFSSCRISTYLEGKYNMTLFRFSTPRFEACFWIVYHCT